MSIKSYCVLDIETTGLSYIQDEIIEIGILKIKNNIIVDVFDKLIKPKNKIPNRIIEITHITNKMVRSGESLNNVLFQMLEFIEDLPLIIHNASFDISFLQYNLEKIGLIINNEIIDTLKLSREIFKDFEKYNLQYLAKRLNIKVENAHRALDDTKSLNEVYKIMRKNIY